MRQFMKYCAPLLAAVALAGCGSEEERPVPVQGLWMAYHDGWMESLHVHDDNCGYIEESMDGLELTADYVKHEGNRYEVIVEEKYPGTLVYDPKAGTMTLTIPKVLPGNKDFKKVFQRKDYFGAMAALYDEPDLNIYSSPDLKEVKAEAEAGQAFQILEITNDWVTLRIPVDATGYVGPHQFTYVKEVPADKFLEREYEAQLPEGLVTYGLRRQDTDIAILKNLRPYDASPAVERCYVGTMKGNAITVDRQLPDISAYDSFDLSGAIPLDTRFTIYVADEPYTIQLYIDGHRYNPVVSF